MDNLIYVLRAKEWYSGCVPHFDGYWTGKTYFHQGEKFAVVTHDLKKTKKYKSRKRAETAAERMLDSVCNYEFIVEELTVNIGGKENARYAGQNT